MLHTGVGSISLARSPKAKPNKGEFTFDTIKKRRLWRQKHGLSWVKKRILTQQDKLPKVELAEISPKNKDKVMAKHLV